MRKFIIGVSLAMAGLALGVRGQPAPPANAPDHKFYDFAPTPPMGWNSWDAFGSSVKEADVVANVDYIDKNLKSHGWTLVTIDIQWYQPTAQKDQYIAGAKLEMDANGRLLPAANRFPMVQDSKSFKAMGDYLHSKGLSFGLHIMRGVPRQAVDSNPPTAILGTQLTCADIANKPDSCRWNTDMYGVDMTKPGAQEYYDSVYKQFASWGLDFAKVDDLAGKRPEIEAIRKAIDKCGRPIVLSISMGSGANQGPHLVDNANTWRISFDFWDNWPALYNQFANLNNFTPYRGPGHWPDADMLPLGNLKTWQKDLFTKFTHDEQTTLMTLWSIGKSPLILGANLPRNDAFTLSLLTNDELIAVDQHSTNNKQVSNKNGQIVWMADVPDSKDKYVALFNVGAPPAGGRGRGGPAPAPTPATTAATAPATGPVIITVPLSDLGLSGSIKVRDLWMHKDLGVSKDAIEALVNAHGAVLYRIKPQ